MFNQCGPSDVCLKADVLLLEDFEKIGVATFKIELMSGLL